jgi:osomolarity two-component system sensor histidine kinase SLN1
VLVVDDDNMTRMLMKRMLSRLGCVVDVAENGQAAVNMICAPLEGELDLAVSTSIPKAKLGTTIGTSTTMGSTTATPLPTPGSGSGSGSYGNQRKSSYGLRPSLPHGTLRYAVVFLDNQMPIMSGLDAVRTLRARGAEAFVVGVTGNALLTDTQEFTEAGANQSVSLCLSSRRSQIIK